jgi:hypothetical protein
MNLSIIKFKDSFVIKKSIEQGRREMINNIGARYWRITRNQFVGRNAFFQAQYLVIYECNNLSSLILGGDFFEKLYGTIG